MLNSAQGVRGIFYSAKNLARVCAEYQCHSVCGLCLCCGNKSSEGVHRKKVAWHSTM